MNAISLFDLEAIAKQVMPHNKWTFVDAGAADEITVRRNRTAFEDITVNPRFLVDVGDRDLSTEVLGEKIDFPVMIAPAGSQRDVHPDGERATAAAAGAMGTLYALPTGSGYSIEEVAEVATGPALVPALPLRRRGHRDSRHASQGSRVQGGLPDDRHSHSESQGAGPPQLSRGHPGTLLGQPARPYGPGRASRSRNPRHG